MALAISRFAVSLRGYTYFFFLPFEDFIFAGFGFFTYYDWFYQRKGTAMQILLCIAAVIANIAAVAITSYPLMIIIYQVKTAIFGE